MYLPLKHDILRRRSSSYAHNGTKSAVVGMHLTARVFSFFLATLTIPQPCRSAFSAVGYGCRLGLIDRLYLMFLGRTDTTHGETGVCGCGEKGRTVVGKSSLEPQVKWEKEIAERMEVKDERKREEDSSVYVLVAWTGGLGI